MSSILIYASEIWLVSNMALGVGGLVALAFLPKLRAPAKVIE